MGKWFSQFLCLLCFASTLHADDQFPETPSPEVMYMFPEFLLIPAVELALPSNFIGVRSNDPSDERVYWGPTNALSTYFLSRTVRKNNPIISAKISNNTKQSELTEENVQAFIQKVIPQMDLKHKAVQFLKWGDHPVVAMENQHRGETIMYAWVGLNSPNGETLLINYLFPNGRKHPTKEEREIWNKFLNETKGLSEQFKFIVNGQDIHPGYTVVKLGPAKFRIVAEKRKSDEKKLIIVQPLNDKTNFEYLSMQDGEMGSTWNYGAKAVKVKGKVKADKIIFDETTTVMYKDVDEFTLNAAEQKLNPKVVVLDGEQKNPKYSRRSRRSKD